MKYYKFSDANISSDLVRKVHFHNNYYNNYDNNIKCVVPLDAIRKYSLL